MKANNPRFLDEQTDSRIRSRFTDPGERARVRREIRMAREDAIRKEREIRESLRW